MLGGGTAVLQTIGTGCSHYLGEGGVGVNGAAEVGQRAMVCHE